MTQNYQITGMTCSSCRNKVTTALQNLKNVTNVYLSGNIASITTLKKIELDDFQNALGAKYKIAPIQGDEMTENEAIEKLDNHCEMPTPDSDFMWSDSKVWKRAGFNTLNCLVGCSIGDFGMLIFLQMYYPDTPMAMQMILAIIAGLTTSVALETVILRWREKLNWNLALKTAIGMSFLSMIAMEIAMNATDFMITGGQMTLSDPQYWLAFIPAAIMGFLVPLPYNYYQLKKYNRACH